MAVSGGYPLWIECIVVAVVIPFRYISGRKEFLFINRGDGKWAFPGGNGGFPIAKDFQDFARIELQYDTGLNISELCYLGAVMSTDNKQLTVCFACDLTCEVVSNGEWFSLDGVNEMVRVGKIAFGNERLIEHFQIHT